MLPVRLTCRTPLAGRDRDFFFEPFGAVSALFGGLGNPAEAIKLDIREDEGRYIIQADIPGFSKDDLAIAIEDDILTLSAEKTEEAEDQGKTYHLRERRYGSVSRSIRLPDDVKAEQVQAVIKDGVLTLTFDKVEAAKPQRIEVKAG